MALGRTDFKNIFREKILLVIFLVAPLAYLAVTLYAFPWLATIYPQMEQYYPILFFLIAIQLGSAFGFVTANIILDEKDQEVLQAIKVMPLTATTFLGFRFVLPMVISFIFTLLLIYLPSLITLSPLQSVQGSLLFSLVAPQVAMTMTILGGNKIEGLAIFKFLNLVIILPAIGIFLPGNWEYALALIPSFWSYKWILDPAASGMFWLALAIQLMFLWFLLIQFRKKVF